MSKEAENIRQALKNFVKNREKQTLIIGKVIKIDKTNNSIDVEIDGELVAYNVKLTASEDSNISIIIYPKINSYVIIGIIENNFSNAALIKYSDIESIAVFSDAITLASNSVVYNGGNNGGLIKIAELINSLNKIERDLTLLKANISSISTQTTPLTGTTLAAALSVYLQNIIPETLRPSLENIKIKH